MRASKPTSNQAQEVRESPLRSRTHNTTPHRLSEYLDDRFKQHSPLTQRPVSPVSTMPVLSTADYILRPQNYDDLPHVIEYQRDPVLMRYFGGPVTEDRAKHRFNLARWHYHAFGYSIFTVLRKEDKSFAGFAGLIHMNFDFSADETEMVICLTQPNWNHHLARQLSHRLLRYAFKDLNKSMVYLRFAKREYPIANAVERDLQLQHRPQTSDQELGGKLYEMLAITPELIP